jgi:hypothetical protein
MSDIRSLNLQEIDGGVKTYCLYRNADELTAGSANNTEYFGFFVGTVGGDWSFTPYDGKAAISFTPSANTYYKFHCSAITPHASGTGFGNLGGYKNELTDAISTWTVDGDGGLTGGVFTVPSTSGSSALTSASSVLPVVGDVYEYTAVVSSYGSATTALITYGGQEIYNKGAAGTYTGELTASTVVGLVVDIDVAITSDFVLDSISIKRK